MYWQKLEKNLFANHFALSQSRPIYQWSRAKTGLVWEGGGARGIKTGDFKVWFRI